MLHIVKLKKKNMPLEIQILSLLLSIVNNKNKIQYSWDPWTMIIFWEQGS